MNNKADLFRMKKKFKNSLFDNLVVNLGLKGRTKKFFRSSVPVFICQLLQTAEKTLFSAHAVS